MENLICYVLTLTMVAMSVIIKLFIINMSYLILFYIDKSKFGLCNTLYELYLFL